MIIVKYKEEDEYYQYKNMDRFLQNLDDYGISTWCIVSVKQLTDSIKTITIPEIEDMLDEYKQELEDERNHIEYESTH